MAQTIIGLNDAKAVKRYSGRLAVDVSREGWWSRKMFGRGETASAPVHELMELENQAGEMVTFDLSMQLRAQPSEGDSSVTAEDLKFYTDSVYINQMRHKVDTGGRMTRKRTLHDLRDTAKKRSKDYWSRVFDEVCFMYASGARGANTDFVFPTTYTGFANNALSAPDAQHIMYANGLAKNTITATDKMSLKFIDQAVAKATMMGGGTQGVPQIQPIKINGEDHYVCLMSPWQSYDLRMSTNTGDWLDIQKSLTTAEGSKSALFKGGLGMHNNVVLQEHKAVITFSDYGAGSNLPAARALFLGDQALVWAWGNAGSGQRFSWYEKDENDGNSVTITTNTIFGCKKTTFNGLDFGVMAIDTAAAAAA